MRLASDRFRDRINSRFETKALQLLLILIRFSSLNKCIHLILSSHSAGIELLTIVQIVLLSALAVENFRSDLTIEFKLSCWVSFVVALHRLGAADSLTRKLWWLFIVFILLMEELFLCIGEAHLVVASI